MALKDKNYQWVSLAAFQPAKETGWKPVPPRRHPSMRKIGNRIVALDHVLMER